MSYEEQERLEAYTDYDCETEDDCLLDDDGEVVECGACGNPATHYDNNEACCSKHSVRDVYGVYFGVVV